MSTSGGKNQISVHPLDPMAGNLSFTELLGTFVGSAASGSHCHNGSAEPCAVDHDVAATSPEEPEKINHPEEFPEIQNNFEQSDFGFSDCSTDQLNSEPGYTSRDDRTSDTYSSSDEVFPLMLLMNLNMNQVMQTGNVNQVLVTSLNLICLHRVRYNMVYLEAALH